MRKMDRYDNTSGSDYIMHLNKQKNVLKTVRPSWANIDRCAIGMLYTFVINFI